MTSTAAGVALQANVGTEAIISGVFVFLVSLVVGAVAITVGAQVLIDRDTGLLRGVITALIGAVAYTVVALFFGWIPLLGPLLMLLVWVGVINWQYPGGWGTALGIGAIAWLVAVAILFVLAQVGVVTTEALGIPGV
jgi:hypothetical protein